MRHLLHRAVVRADLRGVLCQFGQAFPVTLRRSDHFHVLPVVGKLFAAIEAGDIGSCESRGLRAPFRAANGYGEAVASVPATKKCIDQFCNHDPPSIPERVQSWVSRVRVPPQNQERRHSNT